MGNLIKINTLLLFAFVWTQNAKAQETEEKDHHHCLMEESSFSIGVAPQFALNLNTIGSHSRFYFNLNENFCFGPEVSYFDNGHETLLDLDFVAHYIFETKWVGVYPVAGVNYAIETQNHHKNKNLGAVFGAGVHRNIKAITVFAETVRVKNKKDDWLFTLGVMYRFQI